MVFQLTKRLAFPTRTGETLTACWPLEVTCPSTALSWPTQRYLSLVCLPRESHPMVVPVAAFRHLSGRDSHLPFHAHANEQE